MIICLNVNFLGHSRQSQSTRIRKNKQINGRFFNCSSLYGFKAHGEVIRGLGKIQNSSTIEIIRKVNGQNDRKKTQLDDPSAKMLTKQSAESHLSNSMPMTAYNNQVSNLKGPMHPSYPQQMFYCPLFQLPPCQPLFYPLYVADQPNSLFFQQVQFGSSILQQQQRSELSQLQRENQAISRQNQQLRASQVDQGTRVKRKYRKRRLWLQKKFRCNHKNCKKRYSSKIALNSHKRKKHPKGATQPQA